MLHSAAAADIAAAARGSSSGSPEGGQRRREGGVAAWALLLRRLLLLWLSLLLSKPRRLALQTGAAGAALQQSQRFAAQSLRRKPVRVFRVEGQRTESAAGRVTAQTRAPLSPLNPDYVARVW